MPSTPALAVTLRLGMHRDALSGDLIASYQTSLPTTTYGAGVAGPQQQDTARSHRLEAGGQVRACVDARGRWCAVALLAYAAQALYTVATTGGPSLLLHGPLSRIGIHLSVMTGLQLEFAVDGQLVLPPTSHALSPYAAQNLNLGTGFVFGVHYQVQGELGVAASYRDGRTFLNGQGSHRLNDHLRFALLSFEFRSF